MTLDADDTATSSAPPEGEPSKPSPPKAKGKGKKSTRAPPGRASKRKASGKVRLHRDLVLTLSQSKKESPPAEASPEGEAEDNDDEDDASDDVSPSESSGDDSGSEAAPSDDGEDDEEGDDDYEGEHTRKKPRTRATQSQDQKKPSLSLHDRKPSSTSTAAPQSPVTPVTPGALPAARQYVADKMAAVIRTIIGDPLSESDASEYGHAVESTLFSTLNETIKGKQTAGGRYK